MGLLNPFGRALNKNASFAKSVITDGDHNLKGEGMILGGLMVINNKGIQYKFVEETFGDHAEVETVIAEAKKAAA